ncbi:hypothetical protein [Planotetraspora phitsanulokensis]|nr:hypothetical protein [Planotetraspora phitsanulokensis]
MKPPVVIAIVAASAIVLAGLVASAAIVVNTLVPGCQAGNEQLVGTLKALPILDVHPADFRFTDGDSGCDDDDGFAQAWQGYRSTEPFAILPFYEKAALADGWKPIAHSFEYSCFTKEIDGVNAYLNVGVSDSNSSGTGTDYSVGVRASRERDIGC